MAHSGPKLSLTDKICLHLDEWGGYSYGHAVEFPPDVRGVPSSLLRSGTKKIDCSTFTWALLAQVFPDAKWSLDYYKQRHVGPHSGRGGVRYWQGRTR